MRMLKAPILNRLSHFCSPSGRAGVHGCAVATNSYTNAGDTLHLGKLVYRTSWVLGYQELQIRHLRNHKDGEGRRCCLILEVVPGMRCSIASMESSQRPSNWMKMLHVLHVKWCIKIIPMLEALESRRTSTLRYVDIYSLGAAMPDETLWYVYLPSVCCSSLGPKWPSLPRAKDSQWPWDTDTAAMDMAGFARREEFTERVSVTSSNQSPINSKVKHLHHLSPIFSCPWVGSGGFCPISARTETEVRFDGPLCWKNSVADLEECKTYTSYTGTQLWQCLNSTLVEMVRWNDFQVVIVFCFISTLGAGDVVDDCWISLSVEVEHVHSQSFRPRRWPWPQHPRWQAFRTGRKSEIREERERERELINIDLIDIKTKQLLMDKLLHQLEYLK